MKPERALVADRTQARHCPELLAAEPATGELGPALNLLGERLARTLAVGLARLSGTDAPKITPGMPRDCTMATIAAEGAALASHSLLAVGPEGRSLLATFDAAPVFRLVDRAFGGRGQVPNPMPASFPLSAELLIARLEATVATALGEAFGAAFPVHPLRRDTSLRQLSAYAETEAMLQLVLVVQEEGCEPWMLSLAFPHATLAPIFSGSARASRPHTPARPAPSPVDEPFASMPLTVTAVIVDMAIGFSKLADLKPGDVLPVAVARSVPLRIGDQTIATGTIGDLDDRVAVRINHAF
ncbi:FliM/FliN family flagellar motor switch protein [Novosphingobium album (ex Liu et al. 2023)]|uniref:Flagellar motor switch protein FliM n=1 Tax=Novosphingobium album (ex Liu et al. 2023) TaxID=3031130 RepID=A0ABT5WM55_9SPHN|nr:FliM/FliN family flagellar motor switch protein [Novosphingobium album (ex Liu et al. 2023)]MDE8651128.1 FliM/FliN family flagellar motor switch protein [Novosphingobium album (ex Liu et al. 2023)]